MSLRPVARRAIRSSQKIPIKIMTIGDTSIFDFSVKFRHHLSNDD